MSDDERVVMSSAFCQSFVDKVARIRQMIAEKIQTFNGSFGSYIQAFRWFTTECFQERFIDWSLQINQLDADQIFATRDPSNVITKTVSLRVRTIDSLLDKHITRWRSVCETVQDGTDASVT